MRRQGLPLQTLLLLCLFPTHQPGYTPVVDRIRAFRMRQRALQSILLLALSSRHQPAYATVTDKTQAFRVLTQLLTPVQSRRTTQPHHAGGNWTVRQTHNTQKAPSTSITQEGRTERGNLQRRLMTLSTRTKGRHPFGRRNSALGYNSSLQKHAHPMLTCFVNNTTLTPLWRRKVEQCQY